MSENTGLAIGAGIATGIQNAISNLYNVQQAKQNLEQGKAKFDIDKKIADLKLKQFEFDPDFDPEIALQKKDLLNKQYKEDIALYDLKSSMIDATTKGEKDKLKGLTDQYNIMRSFTLGASSVKIGADEQVKRKVAESGAESLTAGERELWARGAKTLGASTGADEQVKRKVAESGLESLTAGERELWDRGAKKTGSDLNAGLNRGQSKINIDEQVKRKVAESGAESLTAGERELWARMDKRRNTDDDTAFLNDGQAPGGAEQAATESPYPDYPDAFQENGVWKVAREGKKYRLEP